MRTHGLIPGGRGSVGSYGYAASVFLHAAIVFSMALGSCGMQSHSVSSDEVVIDSALVGAWYLVEHTGLQGRDLGAEPMRVVVYNADGSVEMAGIHYPTGTLRKGLPLPQWWAGRKITWANAASLEMTTSTRWGETRLISGKWKRDTGELIFDLEQDGRHHQEIMVPAVLGDTVTEPLHIAATLEINGDTLRPYQLGTVPPGRVYVMQLPEGTRLSVAIEGPFGETQSCIILPRIEEYNGIGIYEVLREADHPGHISVAETQYVRPVFLNTATSGSITIRELDLRALRCRGTMDIVFDGASNFLGKGPAIRVRGDFDLPVLVTDEEDIMHVRTGAMPSPRRHP